MPPESVPAPFVGIRVLDLGTDIAAPYAAMFLADQGADVVKVEAVDGDPYRADPGFQTINRNKRSFTGDPATVLRAADVVIVDQPGQADQIRVANPSAVIVAMPPWGERGPKVDDPVTRTLLHAATGIAWNQQSYGEVPIDVVVPLAAYGAGVLGALAAATGLFLRREKAVAATYEVSQVAGAAALQLGEFRLEADDLPRPGDSALGAKGRVGCYRLIEAGDGKWFFLACGTLRFYERLLDVIGRPELIDHPELANPPWGLMLDNALEVITPILDEAFATKPRDEWLGLLAEADVPAQPVLTREEFLKTSIVAANEMDVAIDHPELGEVRMMGLPVTVEGAAGNPTARRAPLLGEHTDEVTAEWATVSASNAVANAKAAESPLAGLRVIDLASFIAGPVVSRHLGMLGADVIKIEAPTGDPFRSIGPMFNSWNQAKQSIILDLRTTEGQAELHRIAATADAVIENFRPGVSTRLGCDQETLRAINPNLVFLSSPGYGLDESMAQRPAFDPLAQALGGFMAAQGGVLASGDGNEPVFLSVPIHDLMTPLVGAFGVVCGLWQRGRPTREGGGGSQHVRTSLIQSTMVAQAAEYTRFAGRPDPALGGFDFAGTDGNTWSEADDGSMTWTDGELSVAIEAHGLTTSPLAVDNGLATWQPSTDFGNIAVFGQLIGGAGPHPAPSPDLGAHEAPE
ncbi:MAG: crotonobetainyl-CoA:carnitine CoA-transferase CaiB-like acyl-CoA transferase [Acidimicrobiales bacterium]|jgi:crotonobetainyl-CoA:carnitine CoA-transferase CaiB-like acyl-CoA transferase